MASAPARILLARHDPVFGTTLTQALAAEGYEVRQVAAAEEELLAALHQGGLDLLVLESDSGPAGLDLLDRLRADRRWEAIPLLLLAPLQEEDCVRALELGAADVLTRPFRVREVVARVNTRLRAGRELRRARTEARTHSELVEILREIASSTSPEEIYGILVRRVARALGVPRCSILIRGDDPASASVVAAAEHPGLRNLPVDLQRYPEIVRALDSGEVVLSDDVSGDPLFATTRDEWRRSGIQVDTTSVIVIPFALPRGRTGAFYLRTTGSMTALNELDVQFAGRVMQSAAPSIERAYEVDEAIQGQHHLRALAESDPLTGLANRRALEQRLARELEQIERYPTVLSCLMVDVDGFKALNDTWGHQVGDLVLTQLAALLKREQRAMDLVARVGGEEFCILLPLTGRAGARLLADRILRRVAGYVFGPPERPLALTVSIGIATWPDDRISDGPSFLDLADQNLLKAKADGRNRYRD
jgi:diguanylate cyclase (GGDEF)-like protein